MFSYLSLSNEETKQVVTILENYFHHSSSNIVRVMALEILVNLAHANSSHRMQIRELVLEALK